MKGELELYSIPCKGKKDYTIAAEMVKVRKEYPSLPQVLMDFQDMTMDPDPTILTHDSLRRGAYAGVLSAMRTCDYICLTDQRKSFESRTLLIHTMQTTGFWRNIVLMIDTKKKFNMSRVQWAITDFERLGYTLTETERDEGDIVITYVLEKG